MLAQPKTLFAYLLGKCNINFYVELALVHIKVLKTNCHWAKYKQIVSYEIQPIQEYSYSA